MQQRFQAAESLQSPLLTRSSKPRLLRHLSVQQHAEEDEELVEDVPGEVARVSSSENQRNGGEQSLQEHSVRPVRGGDVPRELYPLSLSPHPRSRLSHVRSGKRTYSTNGGGRRRGNRRRAASRRLSESVEKERRTSTHAGFNCTNSSFASSPPPPSSCCSMSRGQRSHD